MPSIRSIDDRMLEMLYFGNGFGDIHADSSLSLKNGTLNRIHQIGRAS